MINGDVGEEAGYIGKYTYDKGGNLSFIPTGRAISVEKRTERLETCEQSLLLKYDGKQIEVDRKDLVRSKVGSLLSQGIDCFEHNATTFFKYIHQQEADIPLQVEHESLGWRTYKDEVVFLAKEMITSKKCKFKSEYCGDRDVTPKGKENLYRAMLEEEVVGYTPAEFALVAGASSVVNAYLAKEVNEESLIINLCNDTSNGKSIITQLAVSTSSNPSFRGNTLLTTWLSTPNYIVAALNNNFGMCFAIDEGSLAGGKDVSQILYALASGKEKGKLTKESKLRKCASWSTTIMSTSEGSLLEECNQNGGLRARVFEFANVTWTKSAKSADKIKECIQENYGFLGIRLAQYLAEQEYEEVKKEYLQQVENYLNAMGEKGEKNLIKRSAKKMAILLYTNELINRIWELNLNKQDLLTFVVEHQNQVQSKEIEDRAFDYICEMLTKNYNNFFRNLTYKSGRSECSSMPKTRVLGRLNVMEVETDKTFKRKSITGKIVNAKIIETHREAIILSQVVKEWLKDGGFTNPSTILKKLRDKGILIAEDKKLINRKVVIPNTHRQPTYVFKFPITTNEDKNSYEKASGEEI